MHPLLKAVQARKDEERQAIRIARDAVKAAEVAAVEALCLVKIGDTVKTHYYGGASGVVEAIRFCRHSPDMYEMDVRLLKKDGTTGNRVVPSFERFPAEFLGGE